MPCVPIFETFGWTADNHCSGCADAFNSAINGLAGFAVGWIVLHEKVDRGYAGRGFDSGEAADAEGTPHRQPRQAHSGQTILDDVPVFDTIAEAVEKVQPTASMIFVPALAAADAVIEATAAEIPFAVCIAEGIPALDMTRVMKFLEGRV